MIEQVTLGAYWGSRPETIESCDKRLQSFLKSVSTMDKTLANWYQKGRSKAEALRHTVNYEDGSSNNHLWTVDKLFLKLPKSAGVWNGEPDNSAMSISARCGGTIDNVNLCNSFVMNISASIASETEKIKYIFEKAIDWWSPSWASIWSRSYEDQVLIHRLGGRKINVDWILYLESKNGVNMS